MYVIRDIFVYLNTMSLYELFLNGWESVISIAKESPTNNNKITHDRQKKRKKKTPEQAGSVTTRGTHYDAPVFVNVP